MLNQTTMSTAAAMTDGLLYLSESESGFDVFQLQGIGSEDALKAALLQQKGLGQMEVMADDAATFFIRLTKLADPNDDFMMEQASRFEALQGFLESNFHDIQLYRAGKVQVHIFITATNADEDFLVLHTLAVET